MSQDERYAFIAEWYDPNASLFRRYELLYYPKDSSIEMYDVKNRRMFLRRTKYESLHLEDLYVGSKVTVFSRHLTIVDYGNLYTSRKLGSRKERTLALIKPDGMRKMGQLFDIIINAGLTITKAKMMLLSRKEAADFYADYRAKPFYHELLQLIMSGPILAMELLGDDAVSKWRAIVGPANPTTTESDTLDSISESFGHCGLRDAAYGPDSVASAAKELELFFPSSGGRGPVSSAKFTNCTCCIIKPHAVNEGLSGKIIKAILKEGFEISALQMFNMERPNVEEFYEIYKGVVPEYLEMVSELCSGPCIAMEIRQFDPSKVFRDFCGPSDPPRGDGIFLIAQSVGNNYPSAGLVLQNEWFHTLFALDLPGILDGLKGKVLVPTTVEKEPENQGHCYSFRLKKYKQRRIAESKLGGWGFIT